MLARAKPRKSLVAGNSVAGTSCHQAKEKCYSWSYTIYAPSTSFCDLKWEYMISKPWATNIFENYLLAIFGKNDISSLLNLKEMDELFCAGAKFIWRKEEKMTEIEREITYLSRFWSSNFEEKQQSKGSNDERESAKRNTISENYLVIFDVCF